MKIIILCNVMIPMIAKQLGVKGSVNGGWIEGLTNDLVKREDIELTMCFPITGNEEINGKTDELRYVGFPINNAEIVLRSTVKQINPDIIHIFGTEFHHTKVMTDVCKSLGLSERVIISIQGLVSVIARHYFCNLPNYALRRFTLRDFLKRENIKINASTYGKKGQDEIKALQNTNHIIGRTDWDKACTEQINPVAKYHFCNETLRSSFYENCWDAEKCEKHSIFVSQCSYPIKGFHLMLEAMPEIIKRYPDAHLYTTGNNPLALNRNQKLRSTYYSKYIGKLIKKYNLQNYVTFLGPLDEEHMCERYCKSNVFVCCSSIENSPNSVGEAMLLGVPCVSSDVGGVKNMMTHGSEGFIYPYDEPYMIAHYVNRIFDDENLASEFSLNAKKHASLTHNREANLQQILSIYEEVKG